MYLQCIVSYLNDFLTLQNGSPSVDLTRMEQYVQDRRRAETPSWFWRCRDRSDAIPREEWLVGDVVCKGVSQEDIHRFLNLSHILERQMVPMDRVCVSSVHEYFRTNGLTEDYFRKNPQVFDSFFLPSFVCVLLAETIEHPRAPCTITIPEYMRIQKGLSTRSLKVVKTVLTDCVDVSADGQAPPSIERPVEPTTDRLSINAPTMVLARVYLSEEHKLETPLFVQDSLDTLAVPFAIHSTLDARPGAAEDDEAEGGVEGRRRRLYVETFMLEVEVELADGFTDTLVIHPWASFFGRRSKKFAWKSLLAVDMPDVEYAKSFPHGSSVGVATFVPRLEANIRDIWGMADARQSVERPPFTVVMSDFSNRFVWCMDIPDADPDVQTPSQIKFKPPETPFVTRELLFDLVRSTAEYHVAHVIQRADTGATHVSGASVWGWSTVTYGPRDDFVLIYVSVVYKVGAHHRSGHVVFVSRDPEKSRTFLRHYWKRHEDVLVALAARACKLCLANSMFVPPIPVGRVSFRDEYTPILLKKCRAKTAGCICTMCADMRDEILVPTFL